MLQLMKGDDCLAQATRVASYDPHQHVRILMGTMNGANWLEYQLESFLAQTHRNWTLWISDDGSTDGTREIIERFARHHPDRVERVLEGPKMGSAANYLSLLCHPDLPDGVVALSDQDDVWLPVKLERALGQLAQAGSEPCAWSARYQFTDEELRLLRPSPEWQRGPSLENALVQNILSGHTLTLNPAALALIRQAGPQPVPHHDWWIYLVLMACRGRALVDTETLLFYRQHDGNALGGRFVESAHRTRAQMLMDGDLRDWIEANLQALMTADLPLAEDVPQLCEGGLQSGRLGRLALMQRHGVHRQFPQETALIWVVGLFGRL